MAEPTYTDPQTKEYWLRIRAALKFCEGVPTEVLERRTLTKLLEALTPSLETKQAYMGEFQFGLPDLDEDGNEVMRSVNVPWTTVKEIMAAIRDFAASKEQPDDNAS